jgi:hypothetical protein
VWPATNHTRVPAGKPIMCRPQCRQHTTQIYLVYSTTQAQSSAGHFDSMLPGEVLLLSIGADFLTAGTSPPTTSTGNSVGSVALARSSRGVPSSDLVCARRQPKKSFVLVPCSKAIAGHRSAGRQAQLHQLALERIAVALPR